jgi:hypothetical protein
MKSNTLKSVAFWAVMQHTNTPVFAICFLLGFLFEPADGSDVSPKC